MLMHFTHISLVTAFLSTAPGGMAEMGLTAMLLNVDLSVIIAFQLSPHVIYLNGITTNFEMVVVKNVKSIGMCGKNCG